ncbi:MAG: hypothetical protein KJ831_04835 [Candidatus Eisenbacteria bacterium]|nr:hypothetical protein [Candidatus Eisenbacteria bacterium]
MPRPNHLRPQMRIFLLLLFFSGCGKDSYLSESAGPTASIEFGEGIEVVTPHETVLRIFDDFTPTTHQNRPALPLRELVGEDAVVKPDLYGYRFIGTDGFYPNMPGKGYGDNTWAQLQYGYLDLADIRVDFDTERDPELRNGHNVKWLIQVQLLRSIDVQWSGGRKLATLRELDAEIIPDAYQQAGEEGLTLANVVNSAAPADIVYESFLYRVLSRENESLPRLLTWEEMSATYYVLESDSVVMLEALGPTYQISEPKSIRMEAK